jgi:AcrR family transcriptional regulator
MEDIALEARLSKGAIYLYFESKEILINALMEDFYQQAAGPLQELVYAPGTVSERLMLIAQGTAAEVLTLADVFPIVYEFYAAAAQDQTARGFLKDFFSKTRLLLAALIQEGIDNSEFRQVDPQAVALQLSATFEGLALLWMIDPDSVDWNKQGEIALGLILEGLRGAKSVY